MAAPVLVFGYGNPGRGDDGLGPALLERVDMLRADHPEWPEVELATDFQLQVEHALDLEGRRCVLFADADSTAPPPFSYARVLPAGGISHTTHAMTPQALLHVYERVLGTAPPPSFLIGIRGERFDFGTPLSDAALRNLESAVEFTAALLTRADPRQWEACARA